MLNRFLHARIRAFEHRYGYDGGYMHELADLDRAGFLRFMRTSSGLGQHAGCLPPAAFFAARLAAVMHEDCGPCAQLVVDMALAAGVAPATLAALVGGRPGEADADAALAFRFAIALLGVTPELDALRDAATTRFGAAGPADLGLAVVSARIYPVLKRAMGHAHACQRLRVGSGDIVPGLAARAPA
ncbi:MAG: hypothetical protein H6977_09120 [Gammaproteobacteria bacterium]|nr:hypothetical protein [Gammaproteobacteria bacterium]MCP5200164.1 hypothetical protein [Gammaproteobacteria bacterium]